MKKLLILSLLLLFNINKADNHTELKVSEVNMENSPIEGVKFSFIETNGIRMRLAEMGSDGPLVLFAHGWPESWYSWRHQLTALSEAGFRVVAPDMRGYGETDAPEEIDKYDIEQLSADMVGILDALGEETATIVGHDWGAPVASHSALIYPDRFTKLVIMSVPYTGRQDQNPLEGLKAVFQDNFFYILYHNEQGGVAEKEYDSDPRGLLSRFYLSPDSPREEPKITDSKRSAGGFLPRIGAAKGLPGWLKQKDLDYVVNQFEKAGFRGGVNYYRNIERNWEITVDLEDFAIKVPTLFLAGSQDMVIRGATKEMLQSSMEKSIPNLQQVILLPNIGHWVQQEAPEETNQALLNFLQ
tara:strand:+ start:490 stop:1557 length:1068 start_codon:yes stop_codon:yes gene_type:complete